MYKTMKFQPRLLKDIKNDIDKATSIYQGQKTVFIADSDSLIMKNIEDIIRYITHRFPDVERITSYARAKTLMKLGHEKLNKIKQAGLTRVHVGLESGDAKTLEFMRKGVTPKEIIEGGKAAKDAGLELSFYVLIGAGGKDRLIQHAEESARICNIVNPDFIRLRTLIVQHGSLLEEDLKSGIYKPTSPLEKIVEVKTFVENLDLQQCELASDHFTNYIWIGEQVVYHGIYGILPKDKQTMLDVLNITQELLTITNDEVVDATILYDRGFITSL
jgi:radical SAM superfamily enzyme YgiQ (UPF0313 family)